MTIRKIIFGSFAAAILGGAILIAVTVYDSWHRFAVEDEIHHTFAPVVRALYQYEKEQGMPATNLTQLRPNYISAIPSSRLVSSVEYSVTDHGKVWELDIHSHALKTPRVYSCRSTQTYTAAEQEKSLGKYHVWNVFVE